MVSVELIFNSIASGCIDGTFATLVHAILPSPRVYAIFIFATLFFGIWVPFRNCYKFGFDLGCIQR